MANIPLDETIEIPIESLTNEQRDVVNFIAMGNGFKNPVQPFLDRVFQLIETEKTRIAQLTAESPDGCVEGIATASCPVGCQCLIELDFLFDTLKYELDLVQLHTNKISGVEADTSDFFTRLSVAGQFTKIMNTMTGKDIERYSHVFNSITGGSQACIEKMLADCLCKQGTGCGPFTSEAGLNGIVNLLCQQPELCTCVLGTLLPEFIECVRELIKIDEENVCEAQRVIKNYSNAQTVASASVSDPLMSSIVEGVFATSGLRDKLKALKESNAVSDEFSQSVSKFFPEFGDAEGGGTAGCEDNVPTVVPGIAGPPGPQGCRGSTGPAGPVGPCGDECDTETPEGACCVGDYCLTVTEANCAFYGGDYYGDNSFCFDGQSGVQCLPPGGCTDTGDCNPGLICCNGQCTNPCPAAVGGGCPPCPVCPEGFSECPLGSGNCCQTGDGTKICCDSACVTPCEFTGGCPTCNGACCTSEKPNCCGGTCCSSAQCCGGNCCSDGTFCCDGACVPNGTPCCGSGLYECGTSTTGCCPIGQSCCSTGCCPDACCGSSDACCTECCVGGNCCSIGSSCDCPPGQILNAGCSCECPNGGDLCGDIGCCPSQGDKCCSPPSQGGNNFCCPENATCCGGIGPIIGPDENLQCCDPGESCCSNDDGTPIRCCSAGEECCNGNCCPAGEQCCGDTEGECCPADQCCSATIDGVPTQYCNTGEECEDGSTCPCGQECCPGGGCYDVGTQFCCGNAAVDLKDCLYWVSGECGSPSASDCCCCNYQTGGGSFCENGCCPGTQPGAEQRCSSTLCTSGQKDINIGGILTSVSWSGADEQCPDCFDSASAGCGCDCPCGTGSGDYPCDCKKECPWGGQYCPGKEYDANCNAPAPVMCGPNKPQTHVLSCSGQYIALPCVPTNTECCPNVTCNDMGCSCEGIDDCEIRCYTEEEIGSGCEQSCIDGGIENGCNCKNFQDENGQTDCEAFCDCLKPNTININDIPCDAYNPGNPKQGTGCAIGTMRPDCQGDGGGPCGGAWEATWVPYSSGSVCSPPAECDDCCGDRGDPGDDRCEPPCRAPEVCVEGTCKAPGKGGGCKDSNDCPVGETCANGQCVSFEDNSNTCTTSSDCPPFNACINGQCKPIGGQADPECGGGLPPCPEGKECINGTCQDIEGSACPCPAGYTCYREGQADERCVETSNLGRCCPPQSNCTCGNVCCSGYVLQADCSTGNSWSQGTTCATPCPCTEPAAEGVCCYLGQCIGILEEIFCELDGANWYEIPSQAQETDCNALFCCEPATTGEACDSSPCGCANDLVCCSEGPEQGTCQPTGTCDLPLGECCFADGSCQVTDAPTCSSLGGSHTVGGGCANGVGQCEQPPVLGSCCVYRPTTGDYTCNNNILDINCNHPNVWSENVSCSPLQCDCATGGCCVNGECRSDLNTRVACESQAGGVFFTCRDCDGEFAPACPECIDDNSCSPFPGTCCDNTTGICTADACPQEVDLGICCRPTQQGCVDDVYISRNCCRRGANHPDTQAEGGFCPYEDPHDDWIGSGSTRSWLVLPARNSTLPIPTCADTLCDQPLSCCGPFGCVNLTPQCFQCDQNSDVFCDELDPPITPVCSCEEVGGQPRYSALCDGADCPCYPNSPDCTPDPGIGCNCDGTCIPGGCCGANDACCKSFLGITDCSFCQQIDFDCPFPNLCSISTDCSGQQPGFPEAGQTEGGITPPEFTQSSGVIAGISTRGTDPAEQSDFKQLLVELFGRVPFNLTEEMKALIKDFGEAAPFLHQTHLTALTDIDGVLQWEVQNRVRQNAYAEQFAKYPPKDYLTLQAHRKHLKRVRGRQSRLERKQAIVAPTTPSVPVVMNNIKFQIVNFNQEAKRKEKSLSDFDQETTVETSTASGSFGTLQAGVGAGFSFSSSSGKPGTTTVTSKYVPTTTAKVTKQRNLQQKVSKADVTDNREIASLNGEVEDAQKTIIGGSLTATINSTTRMIQDDSVISFVSGSNIRLDTDESGSFIRIGLDALYMDELTDVGATASISTIFEEDNILQYSTGGNSGGWFPVSPTTIVGEYAVSSFNGTTGAVTGVSSFNGSTGAVTYTPPITTLQGVKYEYASSASMSTGYSGGFVRIDVDADGVIESGEVAVLYYDTVDRDGGDATDYISRGICGDHWHMTGAESGARAILEAITPSMYVSSGDYYIASGFIRGGTGSFTAGEDVYVTYQAVDNRVLSIDGATGHFTSADIIEKSSQSNVATFTISSKGAISTGVKTDSLHRLPYDATLTGIEVVTNNTAGFSAGVVVAGSLLGHPTTGAITGCTLGIAGATGTSTTIEAGLTSASMTAGNFLYMQVYNNAAGATNAQVFATYNRR